MEDQPGFQRQIDAAVTTMRGGAHAAVRWTARPVEGVTHEIWADEAMEMCIACAGLIDPTDAGLSEWNDVLGRIGRHRAWESLLANGAGEEAVEGAIRNLNYEECGWKAIGS